MSKRIILTGGGTGGHITPLIAVARELKKQDPSAYIIYIGERNGKFAHMSEDNPDFDEIYQIFAGKFRRYHKESWLRRIFAVRTNLLNVRDTLYIVLGLVQSFFFLRKLKADIILLKGGFVGVPIGLAAAALKIPFVTHDSDAIPGLANRLVSKWAKFHATGMPPEYYRYPKQAIRYVGVLVSKDYQHVTESDKEKFKTELGMPKDAHVLLVTGGSHGAVAINTAVRAIAEKLLKLYPSLYVIHQVGKGNDKIYADLTNDRLKIVELLHPMYAYTGAADLVITRAGANTMAELGTQSKACIVIPNPLLTGGHQLKNAQLWNEREAAVILDEDLIKEDASHLLEAVTTLLNDSKKRLKLGKNLQTLTAKNASQKLASLLLNPN